MYQSKVREFVFLRERICFESYDRQVVASTLWDFYYSVYLVWALRV